MSASLPPLAPRHSRAALIGVVAAHAAIALAAASVAQRDAPLLPPKPIAVALLAAPAALPAESPAPAVTEPIRAQAPRRRLEAQQPVPTDRAVQLDDPVRSPPAPEPAAPVPVPPREFEVERPVPAPVAAVAPPPDVTEVALTSPEPAPPPPVAAPEPLPAAVPPPVEPGPPESVQTAPRFDAAYLRNPTPAYPTLSRHRGEEGLVLLRVFVTTRGDPASVDVKTSSGFPRLDRAAREAVQRWKFTPARRGDEPVDAWVLVPIRFSLREHS